MIAKRDNTRGEKIFYFFAARVLALCARCRASRSPNTQAPVMQARKHELRWLVPVFHARATSDFLRARTHPRGKQNKYGDGLLCSRKVISPTLRRNLCLPETVSPRKFLVISKYGRKVLPELNARVLGTSLHWCCDRSCLDRGPRKYKHVQGVSK